MPIIMDLGLSSDGAPNKIAPENSKAILPVTTPLKFKPQRRPRYCVGVKIDDADDLKIKVEITLLLLH